jgi:hypothetical protein
MTATVTDISALCRRLLRRPVSDVEFARQHIRNELKDECLPVRVAQAQARAERLILASVDPDKAIKRAIVWARSAIDSTSPLVSV